MILSSIRLPRCQSKRALDLNLNCFQRNIKEEEKRREDGGKKQLAKRKQQINRGDKSVVAEDNLLPHLFPLAAFWAFSQDAVLLHNLPVHSYLDIFVSINVMTSLCPVL